ncbi:hypothetical protein CXIVA_13460 [Clostridium sp. SY8519]|uniref:acyl CoA:acetate/3-ketoacid CoA transferase n=1 Tax=Clostridium sp. (strain SY8519) TaxID=1042156 RepID=UPI0002171FD4|nr:acyl CoA:acetate/3-ketoacid CoA transferase [Clostridium sp. SY8519]BAK47312.1 hypothetical protein CXIVA_13460 [Clostridium sp. SY8519]
MRVQFMSAEEAVGLIPDHATIACSGFVTVGVAEEIMCCMEKKFLSSGSPKDLTLYFAAGQGDGTKGGVNHLAHAGMLRRVIGGHWNLCPQVQKLAMDNEVEAYNLPQGTISHMFRDAAAKKPYTYTKVGLKTFVDPDLEGGKLNDRTKEDIVFHSEVHGEDYLLYETPKLDVVILRGSYADEYGNITLEEEGAVLDPTSMAMACKNNGGKVIVQVKDIVRGGSLDPKLVKIANTMVDIVVKTSDPEKYHQQVFGESFNPCFSGQKKAVLSEVDAMTLNNRKIIARRGALLMVPDATVNLGIGIPEGVAAVLNEEGLGDQFTLTVEAGLHGGVPAGGGNFGEAYNPYMILEQDRQFDFYDGGGLDLTYLGLAQCDQQGNINVSKFGPKIAGCGGFIDISQNTHNIVFCGTFTAGGLKEEVRDGKLHIIQEGRNKKFIKKVEQITFSAEYATSIQQNVVYITERAVFRLTEDGLLLTEIAPGVDLQKDILEQMEFKPLIAENLELMDERIFREEKMEMKL